MSEVSDFVMHVFNQHRAEFTVRDGRLHVWPPDVWHRLSDDEQKFIHHHCHALKAMVRDGRQPLLPDNVVADYERQPQQIKETHHA